MYRPGDGFVGEDEFIYVANDGYGDSTRRRSGASSRPICTPAGQKVVVRSNLPKTIALTSVNPRNRPFVYSITNPPTHGKLTGEAPTLTYSPNPDFAGDDSIGFVVQWQGYQSEPAWVALAVKPNQRPTADGQRLELTQYGRVDVQLFRL